MIDNSTLLELQNGYRFDQHAKSYACLFCRQIYQQGIIYPMEEVLYDAEKAMVRTHTAIAWLCFRNTDSIR